MALEWLKKLLGEAYTEDIDTAVATEIGKGFVSRADFDSKNARVTELETEVMQLREGVQTRDAQLEELKKASGDSEELVRKIEALEKQNKDDRAAYDEELALVKLMAAVDSELTAAGSRNNTAVKAVLADYLAGAKVEDGKVTGKVDGEAITLSAKIEALKADATTDFMFGEAPKYDGWKPGEGGDRQKAKDAKSPADMSYSELAEYLANNPDAELNE